MCKCDAVTEIVCIFTTEQVMVLTGRAAGPEFLKRLTWIAINHDHHIRQIDTVSAFHFGNQFLVEVHIVLPEKMYVKKAHDIQVTFNFDLLTKNLQNMVVLVLSIVDKCKYTQLI